ncbi:Uncharacterized protein TCAP_07500 [Tolypocladium capitatum]|uniref:Uncharacterized protein n=1 Tax=Tolypocladium capitatum TaxID=45235 RepID=A0A2K3PU61_9HYPO|nr:Uncharacterized protein TCAP_07500 [Tolypocladium capitatum]
MKRWTDRSPTLYDLRRRPEVDRYVGRDPVARVRLVDDDFHRRVVAAVDQLQPLVGVLIHDDGHPWHEHEDGRHRDRAIVALVQHHDGLFLGRQADLPLVLGDEDAYRRPLLDLESYGSLYIEVLWVPVQRRHHGDARLPRDPPAFPVASRVEEVHMTTVRMRLVVLVPLLGLERVIYVTLDVSHRAAEGGTRHPIDAGEFTRLVGERLRRNPYRDCKALDDPGKSGAIGLLFKLEPPMGERRLWSNDRPSFTGEGLGVGW